MEDVGHSYQAGEPCSGRVGIAMAWQFSLVQCLGWFGFHLPQVQRSTFSGGCIVHTLHMNV